MTGRVPCFLRCLAAAGCLLAAGIVFLLAAPAGRAGAQEPPAPAAEPPPGSPAAAPSQPTPPPVGEPCPHGDTAIGWPGYVCFDPQLGPGHPPAGCPGGPDARPAPGTACPDGSMPGPPPYGCPGGPSGHPLPGTICPDGSMPGEPPAPAGCRFGVPAPPDGSATCPDGSAPRDPVAEGRLRNVLGLDETGEPHPLDAYDIGCDEGAWNHFLRKLWCGAQAFPFAIGKWVVGVGIDVMGWALQFRLAEALTPVAGLLSQIYDTSLLGPLGIRDLAWTVALFVAGWHLMRAQAARGLAEIAATVLVAAAGAIVVANPHGYLEGSVALAQSTSGAVLEAVDDTLHNGGTGNRGAEAVRARLGDVLRRSFVAEPYDLLNWGRPLSGACAAARDQVLDGGPWGSDDQPRETMRDHGCDTEAAFNAQPSDQRAAGSLIVGLAAVVATVLLVAVALVVFMAQLTLVALFGGASLVWALALFPGAAREVLRWWIGRLAWAVAATIAATFVLGWLAVTVTAVLAASSDLSVVQRSLVALLVVAFAFRLRAQLGRMADHASRRFGDTLHRVTHPAQNRWPAYTTAAGAGGLAVGGRSGGSGVAQTARDWSLDVPGGQYTWNRLYARHFTRGYRRHHGYPGPLRRTLHRAGTTGQALAGTGTAAVRTAGQVARAAVMAPVLGPQAYARTRIRATAASQAARARLHQARATRQQWVANIRHPVEAMRAAHRHAAPGAGRRPAARPHTTPAAATPSPPSPPPERGSRSVGSWWAVGGTPYREHHLPFDRPGVSYQQQTLDLGSPRQRPEPPPRPLGGVQATAQQDFGFPALWYQPTFDHHVRETPPPDTSSSGAPEDPQGGGER